MSLSPQWLDELRTRLTLSAIIGRTTRLSKAGREFRACCPFHNEKSPSFYVNDEKGFYHCFGCGAHGDAIRWLTDQRGIAFMDAVVILAAEAGMEIPAPDPKYQHHTNQQISLRDVMAAAQAWFTRQLAGPEGEKARAYLSARGIAPATAARFGFGYAPEGRQNLRDALRQFPEAMLAEAGLRITLDDDASGRHEAYDRFRGRLMLPIDDARGRVIAFGGRILGGNRADAPKYLNSPETPLFDKGRTLYNLHRAGPRARQTGRLVVVEGYMDAIALSAAGIEECVAPLGTALSEQQIDMLWRLVPTPILCFDGDAPGQRAAMRALTRALPLLRPGHSLAMARLPPGLDPDDLVKTQGRTAMDRLLESARSLIDTLWEHERDAEPLATPEAKAGLKARLLVHVSTITDPDIRALYRRELLRHFSDFAFPQRQGQMMGQMMGQTMGQFTRRDGRRPQAFAPLRPLPETAGRLATPPGGARQRTVQAVVTGLLAMPGEIARHMEALARLAHEDQRLDALLGRFEKGQPLDLPELATISGERPAMPPPLTPPFRFLNETDGAAKAELAEVITLLVLRPDLEAALAAANMRYEQDISDANLKEQARLQDAIKALQKRELDLLARLGQMAQAGDGHDGDSRKPAPD